MIGPATRRFIVQFRHRLSPGARAFWLDVLFPVVGHNPALWKVADGARR